MRTTHLQAMISYLNIQIESILQEHYGRRRNLYTVLYQLLLCDYN